MFTLEDLKQIAAQGIKLEQIDEQLDYFKKGFPFINIIAPATSNNKGITSINSNEALYYTIIFEKNVASKKVMKFVPASGAATRMFKDLYNFSQNYTGTYATMHKDFPEANRSFRLLQKFAFYNDLAEKLDQSGLNIDDCLKSYNYTTIANYILNDIGLGYGNLPKALIKFHLYNHECRTSFEEHLVEAIHYTKNANNQVFVHFTISPEHKVLFINKLNEIKLHYEKTYNISLFVSFSEQKPQTDTIAITENNELFRDEDGRLVFRPAGHGALLENLNACDADIVFVKNIDNVVPDRIKETTYKYKKICGGLLINLQNRIFNYLHSLDKTKSEYLVAEIENFAKTELLIFFSEDYTTFSLSEKIVFLKEKLNRPIRICGMVKNEGEPGGGPFWIEKNNNTSLQIVESSQINHKDPIQEESFQNSTYFNPVDLVCGIKNYKGENFNLQNFIDPETGFISIKSKDGKNLKAQELPGLWNGAMTDWITLFVEVPLITFNPVKTINDLLRPEHQK